MDWREEYKRRLTSADEAMREVKRGDLVVIPLAGPRVLPYALFRRCQELIAVAHPDSRSELRQQAQRLLG